MKNNETNNDTISFTQDQFENLFGSVETAKTDGFMYDGFPWEIIDEIGDQIICIPKADPEEKQTDIEKLNKFLRLLNNMIETCSMIRIKANQFKASSMYYKILDIENNCIEIKIENWNNNYYFIDLDTFDAISMYKKEIKEYREYIKHCKKSA